MPASRSIEESSAWASQPRPELSYPRTPSVSRHLDGLAPARPRRARAFDYASGLDVIETRPEDAAEQLRAVIGRPGGRYPALP